MGVKSLFFISLIAFIGAAEMSTAPAVSPDKNLNYAQLIALKKEGKIVLIDVREPQELQETGILPGAHSIPLGQVEQALKSQPDQFKNKYCFAKPPIDAELVFSCRSGKRSLVALETALKLGYTNSKHYAGGWLDWEKHLKSSH